MPLLTITITNAIDFCFAIVLSCYSVLFCFVSAIANHVNIYQSAISAIANHCHCQCHLYIYQSAIVAIANHVLLNVLIFMPLVLSLFCCHF